MGLLDLGKDQRMGHFLRRFILAGISLGCLACVGCLYVPYCLPEINYVGEVRVPWPSDDVHVFRVDGAQVEHQACGIGCGARYWVDQSYELARLQPSDRKTLPHQWTVGIEHGWVCVGLVNQRIESTKRTVAVCFYRVGYEAIKVGPAASRST